MVWILIGLIGLAGGAIIHILWDANKTAGQFIAAILISLAGLTFITAKRDDFDIILATIMLTAPTVLVVLARIFKGENESSNILDD